MEAAKSRRTGDVPADSIGDVFGQARTDQRTADRQESHSPVHNLQEVLARSFAGRAELGRAAQLARALGSPFVACVLEAGERQLDEAPLTAALIDHWPGDPAAAAVAMRFNAALHSIARSGKVPALSALYRNEHADFDGAIADALRFGDKRIVAAMAHQTQTNEVGRAAAIMGALMVVAERTAMQFELLEIGASCGLNLNLDLYNYQLCGMRAGNASSPVHVSPQWRGAAPPFASVRIASARGVDLQPVDPDDPAAYERMLSYVWADQPERLKRLQLALDLARTRKPLVEQGSAGQWLAHRLAEPQAANICRTVFHSMVIQYLGPQERVSVVDAIRSAGRNADASHPFAWIRFEWTADRSEVRLLLTLWPDGTTRHLASCHPYGAWIQWREDSNQVIASDNAF